MSSSRLIDLPVLALVVLTTSTFAGCVTTQAITPDMLPWFTGNEIVITKTDGTQIRFRGSEYSIDSSSAVLVFHGNGQEFTDSSHANTKLFGDSIRVTEMASIVVRQRTILYYSAPVIFVSILGATLLFAIIWVSVGGGGVAG